MSRLQATIDRILGGQVSGPELLAFIASHPSPLVRANAIGQLPRAGDLPPTQIAAALEIAATDPAHRFRLMGIITVGHLAVAALFRVSGMAERAAALVSGWPEPDRQDLVWFLRSEGISIEP
jgi:hypothetical protein